MSMRAIMQRTRISPPSPEPAPSSAPSTLAWWRSQPRRGVSKIKGGDRVAMGQLDARQSALFLFDEAMAFTYSAGLRAVAALGVADQFADGARSIVDVAAAVGVPADAL